MTSPSRAGGPSSVDFVSAPFVAGDTGRPGGVEADLPPKEIFGVEGAGLSATGAAEAIAGVAIGAAAGVAGAGTTAAGATSGVGAAVGAAGACLPKPKRGSGSLPPDSAGYRRTRQVWIPLELEPHCHRLSCRRMTVPCRAPDRGHCQGRVRRVCRAVQEWVPAAPDLRQGPESAEQPAADDHRY